jgi:hypothetical protein
VPRWSIRFFFKCPTLCPTRQTTGRTGAQHREWVLSESGRATSRRRNRSRWFRGRSLRSQRPRNDRKSDPDQKRHSPTLQQTLQQTFSAHSPTLVTLQQTSSLAICTLKASSMEASRLGTLLYLYESLYCVEPILNTTIYTRNYTMYLKRNSLSYFMQWTDVFRFA